MVFTLAENPQLLYKPTSMEITLGTICGVVAFLAVYCLLGGIYTINQNERAVITNFGRAERIARKTSLDLPIAENLNAEERERYIYPQVRVVGPGGPYLRMPWQKVYRVSIAIQTINIGIDPDAPQATQADN